jgi:membrane protein DedA with SNARE-associated domain
MNYKNILKALSIPFTLLVLTLIYHAMWKLFGWPKGDELVLVITEFFNTYGLWMVFVCAILESALLVGNFFPGGLIIFLSVIAAGHNVPKIVLTASIVSVGFFIGYGIDYMLGRYGWYKLLTKFGMKEQIEHAKAKLIKQSFNAIILSYWEVNLASITATAAGVLKMDVKKFLFESTISIIVWNIFWTILVVSLGTKALDLITNLIYVIPVIVVWVVVIVIKHRIESKRLI